MRDAGADCDGCARGARAWTSLAAGVSRHLVARSLALWGGSTSKGVEQLRRRLRRITVLTRALPLLLGRCTTAGETSNPVKVGRRRVP